MLLSNNFEINLLNNDKDIDLSIIPIFKNDFCMDLHILRHDNTNGWQIFEILFHNQDNSKEKIYIDAFDSSYKIYENITTKTQLFPITKSSQQIIPKKIVQTSEETPSSFSPAMMTLKLLNDDYEHFHFNKIQRREFIKQNFSKDVLLAYDTLTSGAFQADLFRYCFLFIHGGCYFDDKVIARESLDNIIKEDDDFLICNDYEFRNILSRDVGHAYLNAIIMTKENNPLLKSMIDACVDNILNKQDYFMHLANEKNDENMLLLTGPRLFFEILNKNINKEKQIRFKHTIYKNLGEDYRNYHIVDVDSGKILFTKTNKLTIPNPYLNLYYNRELFYRNFTEINSLRIFVYPHPYCDTFHFMMNSPTQLLVERKDSHDIWHFNLRLKIINNENSHDMFESLYYLRRTIELHNNDNMIPKLFPTNVTFYPHHEQINLKEIFVLLLTSMKKENEIYQRVNEIRKQNSTAFILLALTCENYTMDDLYKLRNNKIDHVILYNTSHCKYFCQERNLPNLFISKHITSFVKNCTLNYFFGNEKNSIQPEQIENVHHFCCEEIENNICENEDRLQNYYNYFSKNYQDNLLYLYDKKVTSQSNIIISELERIIKACNEKLEGNTFYEHETENFVVSTAFAKKRLNLFHLSSTARNILEIGFNAGHSTLLYLLSNPSSQIYLFDLGEHSYSYECFRYLNEIFPGRLHIVWGSSLETVKNFEKTQKFDFIHIDGGHTRFIAESDIHNCRKFATKYTNVVFDDSNDAILYDMLKEMESISYIKQAELKFPTRDHFLFRYLF